jgi:hypothetical protein
MKLNNKTIKNLASRGDERTVAGIGKASATTLYLTYIYLTVIMVIKILVTKRFESSISDIVLLLLITATFLISSRFNKEYSPSLPVSMNGKTLNTDLSRKGRFLRIIKYLWHSITITLSITFGQYLLIWYTENRKFYKEAGFLSETVTWLITLFVISFLVNYIISERKIKKYVRYLEALEREDEE